MIGTTKQISRARDNTAINHSAAVDGSLRSKEINRNGTNKQEQIAQEQTMRSRFNEAAGHPSPLPPVLGWPSWAQPICRSAAPLFFWNIAITKKGRASCPAFGSESWFRILGSKILDSLEPKSYAVACRSTGCRTRWCALRPKNSAWLTTADTTAS